MNNFQTHERYLRLLSERFTNADAVVTELINLHAILSLPKGTEHFVSDLHGASSAFIHMIKNASGVIRRKVDDVYGDQLTETTGSKRPSLAAFVISTPKLSSTGVSFVDAVVVCCPMKLPLLLQNL